MKHLVYTAAVLGGTVVMMFNSEWHVEAFGIAMVVVGLGVTILRN